MKQSGVGIKIDLFTSERTQKISLLLITLGFIFRFSLVLSSSNFDFESYKITASLILNGIQPWQSQRYNYGITWSLILAALHLMSPQNDFVFRLLLIGVLSLADYSIYLILKLWFSRKIGLIFFLNPISIIITGHYNQFDNLSIAIGLIAMNFLIMFGQNADKKYLAFSVISFALSLTIKHNLVLFLPWLLFSRFNLKIRLTLVFVPFSFFLAHFIPFMLTSVTNRDNILSAVFKYWSANNAPFWKFWFWDKEFAESLGDHTAWHHGRLWMLLMIISVTSLGYLVSEIPLKYQLPIFSIAIIIFASAVTSQFLAIAAIGAAVYFNLGFFLYYVLGSLFLSAELSGLNITYLQSLLYQRGWNAWNIAPTILTISSLFQLYKAVKKRNSIY